MIFCVQIADVRKGRPVFDILESSSFLGTIGMPGPDKDPENDTAYSLYIRNPATVSSALRVLALVSSVL